MVTVACLQTRRANKSRAQTEIDELDYHREKQTDTKTRYNPGERKFKKRQQIYYRYRDEHTEQGKDREMLIDLNRHSQTLTDTD